MKRRVVVTGMGAITPIGLSVGEFWDAVKQKKLGFAPITHFDASEYKCHLAAEVKGFEGKNYMDFKSAKRMELFSQYASGGNPKKRSKTLSLIWDRRMHTVQAVPSVPVSEAFRQSNANIKS